MSIKYNYPLYNDVHIGILSTPELLIDERVFYGRSVGFECKMN